MGRARRPIARRGLGSTVSTGRLLSPLPLGLRDDEFFFTVHQIAKLGAGNNTPPHQDFINLVSSDDDDIAVSQPPAKRAKTEETVRSDTHKDYVPLARCTLRFSRAAEDDAPPPKRLRRIPANSFYALRYSSGKGLSITARGRKVPAVSDGAFSPDDIGGLSDADRLILDHLAKKSTSVDPLPGCLFTAYFFSVDVDSNADTVSLVIDLELRWMLCSYVSNLMHSETERVWQARVLATLFPNVVHGGGHQYKNATDNDTWSPQDFYESAHVTRKDDDESDDLYVPGLTANLFPFQRRAVKWLLRREGVRWAPDEATSVSRGTIDDSEPSVVVPYKAPEDRETTSHFVAVKDADGNPCYISQLFGAATRDPSYFEAYENSIRGGILSEEMGLGKTVEVISLVLLHPRPADQLDAPTSPRGPTPSARPTGATLVIAPPALKNQWISEIQQHAPHLRVMVYSGMARSCSTPEDEANVVEQFATHDVVVTTYSDLKSELHFAVAPPERNMRSQSDDVKRYRPRSPLVQMSWWRVCLDEAQEIENGVSNTATLVRIVPRVNAWGVTGTPVKDDVQDLRGLLLFLSYEPYASIPKVWQNLTRNHKRVFRNLFGRIALRHSKRTVGDELVIPPQKRYVITMPFTAVEEQHYQSLFKQLTEACGLDTAGGPLSPDWNPNDSAVLEAMRTALSRLRQTALHPEIGVHNPRVGHRAGPMRTVEEVLNAMIEQSESALLATRRAMLSCKLKHGQLFENSPRAKIAVDIWQDVLEESRALVQDARDKLEKAQKETALEEEAAGTSGPHKTSPGDESSDTDDDDDLLGDEDGRGKAGGRVGEAQRDLRFALEILHKAEFFCANGYFQIKSNAEWTRPDSDEFRRLEKLEVEGYERAKRVRQEILADNRSRAMRFMADLAGKAGTQGFVEIPETEFAKPEGIEGRRISDELDHLAEVLSTQAAQMDAWREAVIQLLLKDLVDDDEDKAGEAVEITGDEYEDSTKVQDEIQAYITILKAGISDRNMLLTGLAPSGLALYEERLALRMAKDNEGPAPELTLRLFAERQATLPKPTTGGAVVRSLRAAVIDLRDIASRLRGQLSSGSSLNNITSQRAQMELECVTRQLKRAQDEQTRQLKVNAALEKEANKVRNALNSRIAFYRQLQAVSDMVALYEGPKDEETIATQIREENDLLQVLTKAEAKHRYLVHLKEAESKADESRMCVICQTEFWTGVLTVCGHQFCKECITLWFKAHRNCPVCKRKLTIDNLHDITLKRQALKVTDEHGGSNRATDRQDGRSQQDRQEQQQEKEQQKQREQLAESKKANIYAAFSTDKLEEIKNIDLPGPSFTTKVDTIVRHLLWLRSTDPGAKSIVFSQYPAFLSILAEAFRRYHIAFSRYTDRNGIERFKDDPSIECFLLHARAHASGLNLVNASHVLLCEPLLNTAIELQAIARVHRIGQQHETTVWLYIVDGTVEASIYDLSVKRRVAHMGRDGRGGGGSSSSVLQSGGKGKGRGNETPELLDSSLELANSLEMQQAQLSKLMSKGKMAGEEVAKGDLWTCLFGNASSNASEAARTALNEDRLRNDLVVRRHLTASAAEERQQHNGEGEASGSA
ncbi:E3 ubiquitin-protein ligase SHPRH [Sporothrix brasiliensis 5110]|uniref:E3 ubiquitin-protein ligase SHPRH n=1 Tax=Sporothrix brasiliensis 5110 TaxID=1398154 RepID=A0A0C2J692_9PEZI|nr:E3 ubiquitin-protein ligase SHPRH [Sporothrix brasiliensis 5110]KIH94500.1 E3 ubiquitin-protein ligase SHPRH [Sporothrix brasiliensis 5110]